MTKLCFVILIAFILVAVYCYRCEARISQSQAESAVRDFEGNSSLEFDKVQLVTERRNLNYAPLYPSAFKEYYVLHITSPSKKWYVNAQTGEVCIANYIHLWDDLTIDREIFGPYTQVQCRAIALAFARAKYLDFDLKGFTIRDVDWSLNSWGFAWSQIISPGAVTPSFVYIRVNPATGDVVCYYGEHVTIAPITATPITQQQAAEAVFTFNEITSNKVIVSQAKLYVDEQGTLYYSVEVNGNKNDNSFVYVTSTLDASSGNVLWQESPGSSRPSSNKSLSTPNKVKNGKVSITGKKPIVITNSLSLKKFKCKNQSLKAHKAKVEKK